MSIKQAYYNSKFFIFCLLSTIFAIQGCDTEDGGAVQSLDANLSSDIFTEDAFSSTCTPGARTCLDNVTYICNEDGSLWLRDRQCLSGQECILGECIGEPQSSECGNGIREDGEQCDSLDLGELTCNSFGESTSGNINCTSNCLLDATQCVFDIPDAIPDDTCLSSDGCSEPNNIIGGVNWIDATQLTGSQRSNARASGLIHFQSGTDPLRCSATIIDRDLIITNHHCISNSTEASTVRFFPTWESGVSSNQRITDSFSCPTLVATNCSHDISILRCLTHPGTGQKVGDTYGIAQISLITPSENQQLYLIHTNCDYRENDCNYIKLLSPGIIGRYGEECITFSNENNCENCRSDAFHIRHNCDSLGGSSGGGIFDASTHQLIGLNWGSQTLPNDTGGYNLGTSLADLASNSAQMGDILRSLIQNQLPTAPIISNLPSSTNVNVPTAIQITLGVDPDGTQTKVQCRSSGSNYDTSPYDSDFRPEGTTVTVNFTWSTTGTKTIYCTTFDQDGGGSPSVNRIIVVNAVVNQAPTAPQISSSPSSTTVNAPTSIQITLGTDPDGTQTKVRCSSTDSNYPEWSAYDSSLMTEGSTINTSWTWSSTGSKTISCTTFDSVLNNSPASSRSISVSNSCSNQCTLGARQCSGSAAYQTCVNGSQGCTVWGSSSSCPSNQVCTGTGQCTISVPSSWTCSAGNYGSADGCHCGCGAVDLDCSSSSVSACQYCGPCGGCSSVNASNNSQCITCTANAYSACYNGNRYWYDSCGNQGSVRESCSNGCGGDQCNSTLPSAGTRQSLGGMYFRYIPSGTFMMGSPPNELYRASHEVQHVVTLTKSFWMKETEVTQTEWQAIMGNNPSSFTSCGGNCPVERISWWDAVQYCNALSNQQGLSQCYTLSGCSNTPGSTCSSITANLNCTGYRLPTEAEWEYAYRAGQTAGLYNGSEVTQSGCDTLDSNFNSLGWYCGNSGVSYSGCVNVGGPTSCAGPHPVSGKQANDWGLYDMAGNVWEWVWDWYGAYPTSSQIDPTGPVSGTYRVDRGGAWNFDPQSCRAAMRDYYGLSSQYNYIGLRIVKTY